MTNFRNIFSQYLLTGNVDGSGKAKSYVKALDLLSEMLVKHPYGFSDCRNIWAVASAERMHELYLLVLDETKKKDDSAWNIEGIPKSYLQNGFCSAALKSYQEFLTEHVNEQKILVAFDDFDGKESEVAKVLNIELSIPEFLLDGLDKKHGKDIARMMKVRINQSVFRKMILKIYNQTCCITGLDIPEVNRASHIIPWSKDKEKRLEPQNGLCLSATYDAAFDRNLISLDDNYQIIISKRIKDHYSNKSVKDYFATQEGNRITLPGVYRPNKDYLATHREKGEF